jgi:hypothetical protein
LDFDDPNAPFPPTAWSGIQMNGGLSRTTGLAFSGTASMRASEPGDAACACVAQQATLTWTAGLTSVSALHVEFELYAETITPLPGGLDWNGVVALVSSYPPALSDPTPIFTQNYKNGAPYLTSTCSIASGIPFPATLNQNAWNKLSVDINCSAQNITYNLNGTVSTCGIPCSSGNATVQFGLYSNGVPAWTVHFDNVVAWTK